MKPRTSNPCHYSPIEEILFLNVSNKNRTQFLANIYDHEDIIDFSDDPVVEAFINNEIKQ